MAAESAGGERVSAPRWAVGMRKLGPGLYFQASDNSMHFSAEEVCEQLGVTATRENMEIAERGARKVIETYWPNAKVEVLDADPS